MAERTRTERLGLIVPQGNENVMRQDIVDNIEDIDDKVALQTDLENVEQKVGQNTTEINNTQQTVATHLAQETQHHFTESNEEISVDFKNKFFFIDGNNDVFYKPNGDGNAGSSLGEQGYINLWRVI